MKAKRCNRCLNCFVPEEEEEETAEIPEIFFHSGKDIIQNRFSEHMTGIDLCPMCTVDYRRFMNGCTLKIDGNNFDRPDGKKHALGTWL